jgi:hypothetical protein
VGKRSRASARFAPDPAHIEPICLRSPRAPILPPALTSASLVDALERRDPGERLGIRRPKQLAARGSTMNEHVHTPNVTLGQMVRTRLATGSLFLLRDGTVNEGRGTGKRCTVCGMPIFATEVENEVLRPRTAYAHSLCHSVWMQESSAFQESHA